MKILTLENKPLDLNTLPDQIEEDIRFSILDNSDSNNPDFFYVPLIFLESFSSPSCVLDIGGFEERIPIIGQERIKEKGSTQKLRLFNLGNTISGDAR